MTQQTEQLTAPPAPQHRNGVVLTSFNHAGGVAKSSTVRDLGYSLSQRGYRVLLIDADPQGSLTKWMGLYGTPREETIYDVLVSELPMPQPSSVHGMDIIASHHELSEAELMLGGKIGAEKLLSDAIEPLRAQYDVILIDPGPNLGRLTINGLVACDRVIIPLPTNSKGTDGLGTINRTIMMCSRLNPTLRIGAFVISLYDMRNGHDQSMLSQYRANLGKMSPVICGPIPMRSALYKDAQLSMHPVALGRVDAKLSEALRDVADQIEGVIAEVRAERLHLRKVPDSAVQRQEVTA